MVSSIFFNIFTWGNIQFDEHIFQLGWKHQLARLFQLFCWKSLLNWTAKKSVWFFLGVEGGGVIRRICVCIHLLPWKLRRHCKIYMFNWKYIFIHGGCSILSCSFFLGGWVKEKFRRSLWKLLHPGNLRWIPWGWVNNLVIFRNYPLFQCFGRPQGLFFLPYHQKHKNQTKLWGEMYHIWIIGFLLN